jgi:RNase P subunit RPR2
MLICDLCRKPLVKGKEKWVNNDTQHICETCIKICNEIVKDPNTGPLTYLNQYREEKDI